MRKLLLLLFIFQIMVSGCGVNSSLTSNMYNVTTNVDLTKKNYHIVKRITGTASDTYIFGIGGLSNQSLLEVAKKEMFNNIIEKDDGAYAVAYITTEVHRTFFPYYYKKTVVVSGYLIEFTE